MALNFPDNPTTGQLYTDSTAGFTYEWDGYVWQSYTAAAAANIKIIDDLESSFNNVTVTFALTSSGNPVTPINPQQLRIVLGGIVQEPAVDYNVAGSDIIFTTAPTTGLSFSGVLLGGALSPVGLASTGSVYVRQSYSPTGVQTTFTVSGGYRIGYLDVYHNGVKLVVTDDYTATNGSTFDLVTPAQNGDTVEAVTFLYTQLYSTTGILDNLLVTGNATVTGVTTLGNTVVGGGTTQLLVNGNARVTGILTVGTSSITLDGVNNTINVGSLTISQSGISGGTPDVTARNISGVAATFTGNVSVGGTLTYEDVTNVDSVGLITARAGVNVTGGSVVVGSAVTLSSGGINVAGVVTATSFVGNGSGLSSLDAGDISAGTLAIARGGTNSTATPTTGGAAYGTGSAFAFTSSGTSGQVLTSNGTSAPTWATPAAGGSWIYISSVTASNSASVAFTSGIDSTYNRYVIVGSKIIPATDRVELRMRSSSNGGSSYDSGASDYRMERQRIDIQTIQTNSDHMKVATEIPSASSSYAPLVAGASFNIFFDKLTDTSYHKNFHVEAWNYFIDSGIYETYFNNTKRAGTSAINALQFFFSSGNIASGTFTLYGIKNS